MINITQNKENNIIIITEEGKISFDDKLILVNRILSEIENKENIRVLHDMRNAEYKSTDIENDSLLNLASLFKNKINFVKHAAVHESAVGTAISMLFERSDLPENYKHKIFYSKETALQWLLDE